MATIIDKLKQLRQAIKDYVYDGLLIPRTDCFQGEYVQPSDERLKFISGFDGSAGMAVITADQAMLFVDGRYTVQAKIQAPEFLIANIQDLGDWLQKNVKKIAVDPWLITVEQWQKLEKIVQVVSTKNNLVDGIWFDRPSNPLSTVINYPLHYAGITVEEKLQKVTKVLQNTKCEHFIFTNPESICWLLNIRGNDLQFSPIMQGFAVLSDNVIHVFPQNADNVIEKTSVVWHSNQDHWQALMNFISNLSGNIALDYSQAPYVFYELCGKQKNQKIFNVADPCIPIKALKNPIEQKWASTGHIQDGVAMCQFLSWLSLHAKEEITEIQAADYLEQCRSRQSGYTGLSFATIAAANGNGAIIHYHPTSITNISISPSIFLIDSGGQYLGCTTDVTRTVAVNIAPTDEQKNMYTMVLKGHIALANAIFPVNTNGSQLDVLARQFLWQQGVDYAHGTGHGVGSYLSVHEGPQAINTLNRYPLQAGMIVSNEPGFYQENDYGIRLENLMLITPSEHSGMLCFEPLTLVPFDPLLIEYSAFNNTEKKWLKNYYEKIWQKVSPYLNPVEIEWLRNQTTLD